MLLLFFLVGSLLLLNQNILSYVFGHMLLYFVFLFNLR